MHTMLAGELKNTKEARAVATNRIIQDDEPVFLSRTGRAYRDCRSAWATAVRRAGLGNRKGLTFHALRGTFACHFLEGGAAVTDLQALLGHASLSTTQIYARMVDERTKASVAALSYETGANGENVRTSRAPADPGEKMGKRKAAPGSP
jgi:site-specific recombinase XerD